MENKEFWTINIQHDLASLALDLEAYLGSQGGATAVVKDIYQVITKYVPKDVFVAFNATIGKNYGLANMGGQTSRQ